MLTISTRPERNLWRLIALLGAAWLTLAAQPAAAQGGPIRLFPDLTAPSPDEQQAPTTGPRSDAPRGFQVEGLEAPGLDSIGLGPGEGGFEPSLWAGSSAELVLALLADLPVASENPPLRALTRRLLMTGAPLEGLSGAGRLLAARVDRLLAMGALDDATALLERVPSTTSDSELARLVVQAALLTGDDGTACRRAADIAPNSSVAFWAKVTVYCQLVDGDEDGARLGLQLLREEGQSEDAAFFALVEMIASGGAGTPPAADALSPLHVALFRLAGQPLPAAALRSGSPELLAAAMRAPSLIAGDRLAVAERAFLVGALSADGLAARYDEQAPAGDEDVLRRVERQWSPRSRALAYQAVGRNQPTATRAELLNAVWRAARGSERFLIADVFAAPFAALPVERSLIWVAPTSARALLAAGRSVPAARWFSLLSADAGSDAQARDGVARLVPLFALAGFGGSDAVPEFDTEAVARWRLGTPDADAKQGRLLALLEGVGAPVPAAAWHDLIGRPGQDPTPAPPVALWRGLERAAAERHRGETVLFALHLLGGRPQAAHPEAVAAGLRGLRSVGLDQDARAIALATALSMGL